MINNIPAMSIKKNPCSLSEKKNRLNAGGLNLHLLYSIHALWLIYESSSFTAYFLAKHLWENERRFAMKKWIFLKVYYLLNFTKNLNLLI